MKSRSIVFSALVLLAIGIGSTSVEASPRKPPQRFLDGAPPWFTWQFEEKIPAPNRVTKSPGHYSRQDWAAAIDSAWGPGMSYDQDKLVCQAFWNNVDANFACSTGLDATVWDDVWDKYYPDILDTVSRGRLSGIVNHSCLALKETHTKTYDNGVYNSALDPGVPLLICGAWGNNRHFGAGLTVMPDSSLLVYKAVESHPLGLVPGDQVLGCDGISWKEVYPDLIAAELPMAGWWWGSCEESFHYSFLVAGGMNWHLFDTIDCVKYATVDTLHLATSALIEPEMTLWATEQIDIPGVPMPDVYTGELTSWGIVEGTNIGYLYSQGWLSSYDSAVIINTWLTGLDSPQNQYDVDGIILDSRTNFGTTFSAAGRVE